jgi:hypothetical protein
MNRTSKFLCTEEALLLVSLPSYSDVMLQCNPIAVPVGVNWKDIPNGSTSFIRNSSCFSKSPLSTFCLTTDPTGSHWRLGLNVHPHSRLFKSWMAAQEITKIH